MISKDILLNLIAEEKELYSKYTQLCAQYQIQPDPLAISRHHGKMEILQRLLKEMIKI